MGQDGSGESPPRLGRRPAAEHGKEGGMSAVVPLLWRFWCQVGRGFAVSRKR